MTKVEIYSTSACVYCVRAKQLLQSKGITFTEYRIDQDTVKREEMLTRAPGARTVPQIFINDESIGGFDALWALDKAGALNTL